LSRPRPNRAAAVRRRAATARRRSAPRPLAPGSRARAEAGRCGAVRGMSIEPAAVPLLVRERGTDAVRSARVHRADTVDAAVLANALGGAVRGEVRFDAGSRALYATDGSNYRQPPIGVVIPRDSEDVERAV